MLIDVPFSVSLPTATSVVDVPVNVKRETVIRAAGIWVHAEAVDPGAPIDVDLTLLDVLPGRVVQGFGASAVPAGHTIRARFDSTQQELRFLTDGHDGSACLVQPVVLRVANASGAARSFDGVLFVES